MAPQHFLVVTFNGQGNINPSRALAVRLVRATGARVTLSAAVSMHRLMFPSLAAPDEEAHDGVVSYVPYSDGYDHGFRWFAGDAQEYMDASARVGRESLSGVLDRLAARGRPVTCVVYNIMMWWAGEVARGRGVPSVLYWVQQATLLAVYYHYFHGYERLVTEHAGEPGFRVTMPGLPPMAIRDLPSFFTNSTDSTMAAALGGVRKTIEQLDVEKSRSINGKAMVLVNTVEELEAGALTSIPELDILTIGPAVMSLVGDSNGGTRSGAALVRDLHKHDEQAYMEWLDTKPARSVVYVSSGSLSTMSKRQKEEMKRGLAASGRPYLWVMRKNDRDDGVPVHDDELAGQGMVVEWCDQVRVLSHAAIGCFVTHCGWNSTLESVACGVPMVAMPQWTDQDTNARLVVEWGIGVRAAVAADGVLEGEELNSCLEMVMGDMESGVATRRSSAKWKAKVMEATAEGGSSDRNWKAFLDQIANEP